MLFIGITFLVFGVLAALTWVGVISLADKTARRRLLDKRSLEESKEEHRRFKMIETSSLAQKIYRPRTLEKLERKITIAGYPDLWTVRNIMGSKILLPTVALIMSFAFGLFNGQDILKIIAVVLIVVAWFVPNLLLGARVTERTQIIERGLPDLLDKLYIALKAGLGFDSALAESLKTFNGPLADELLRTVQDIRVGMARRDAYDSLRLRTASSALHTFIRSIQQAEEKGTSVSAIVKQQSNELRMVRRMRAEGKAQQVSVKLLGPLMTCVFPVLFIVILAPSLLSYSL